MNCAWLAEKWGKVKNNLSQFILKHKQQRSLIPQ